MSRRLFCALTLWLAFVMGAGPLPSYAQALDQTLLAPPPELPAAPAFPLDAPKGALDAPAAPQPGAPASPAAPDQPNAALKSLAPPAMEVVLPDTLMLEPRPALIAHGKSDWEKAYDHIRDVVATLRTASDKANLTVTGYPLTLFIETSDTGFTYDIMLPIAVQPTTKSADLPPDIRLGETPTGKAIRFVHLASYDEIDGAYEEITAYLDAKNVVVKDAFIEEYVTFGEKSNSPETTINIFVQPKK